MKQMQFFHQVLFITKTKISAQNKILEFQEYSNFGKLQGRFSLAIVVMCLAALKLKYTEADNQSKVQIRVQTNMEMS